MRSAVNSRDAIRTLSRMPASTARLIRDKIDAFVADPRSLAANVKALKGDEKGRLRLWVGDWRVILSDDGQVVAIIRIAARGRAYD